VENRQNPVLIKLLTLLTESENNRDVIVSHDRFTIYRATIREDSPESQNTKFSTGDKNLHLDLNPWWWDEDSQDIIKGVDTIKYDDIQVLHFFGIFITHTLILSHYIISYHFQGFCKGKQPCR
jgi:hypothetical protein